MAERFIDKTLKEKKNIQKSETKDQDFTLILKAIHINLIECKIHYRTNLSRSMDLSSKPADVRCTPASGRCIRNDFSMNLIEVATNENIYDLIQSLHAPMQDFSPAVSESTGG